MITLYTDGTSRDLECRAAIGASVRESGIEAATLSEEVSYCSSQEAEECAALRGMELAHGLGMPTELFTDSTSVRAVARHRARKKLTPTRERLYELCVGTRVSWIPRKKNWRAHQLAFLALQPSDTLGALKRGIDLRDPLAQFSLDGIKVDVFLNRLKSLPVLGEQKELSTCDWCGLYLLRNKEIESGMCRNRLACIKRCERAYEQLQAERRARASALVVSSDEAQAMIRAGCGA